MSAQDCHFRSKIQLRCFGVDIAKTRTFHCFLWPDFVAGKGPNEVISVFNSLLHEQRISSRHCIVSSDNCPSEFKNNYFSWYLQSLVDMERFQRIDHKMLLEGHTYSCVDRKFGLIEKNAKKIDVIEKPQEWLDVIEQSSFPGHFTAKLLTVRDIYDYESYLQNEFTFRYKDINGKKFLYDEMHYFNYGIGERCVDGIVKTYAHPGTCWIRKTLDPKEDPVVVSFKKNKQFRKLTDCQLLLANNDLKPLKSKVYKDINQIAVKYLSPNAQQWYESLPHQSVSEE